MSVYYSSRCKFICPQAGFSTTSLHMALEWSYMGFDILFYYNGKFVGELVYGGEIDTPDDIPQTAPFGTVFYCRADKGFYHCIQEDILRAKPLVKVPVMTFSSVFVN